MHYFRTPVSHSDGAQTIRSPRALVNREMWRNIIVMSLYQLIVCLVLLFAGEDLLDLRGTGDHHYIVLRLNSVIFNSFVFMQIFSEINSRKIAELNIFENIQKSPIFVGIIIVTIATQVAFIEVLDDPLWDLLSAS